MFGYDKLELFSLDDSPRVIVIGFACVGFTPIESRSRGIISELHDQRKSRIDRDVDPCLARDLGQ